MPYDNSDKMGGQQGREGVFHPASPHSSSGVADSYKSTPDTRLTTFSPEDGSTRSLKPLGSTTFSPEDGSTRSLKPLGSLGAGTRENGAIRYPVKKNASQTHEHSGSFHRGNLHLDKDPFISHSDSNYKPTQKLSPTASVFSPLSAPHSAGLPASMAAHGPSHGLGYGSHSVSEPNKRAAEAFTGNLGQGTGRSPTFNSPPPNPSYIDFIHTQTSTDAGVSRCLVVSPKAGGSVVGDDLERYFIDLQRVGIMLPGRRQIFECGGQVYLRFTNIRSSCTVFSNLSMGDREWVVRSISPREYMGAVDPQASFYTAHEGQLYMSVFMHPPAVPVHTSVLETIVKQLLQTEGDLFAFKTRPGVHGSMMSAIVEYCENQESIRAAEKFHNVVLEGFQICITLYRPDLPPHSSAAGNVDTELVAAMQRMTLTRGLPIAAQSVLNNTTRSSASASASASVSVSAPSAGYPLQPSYDMLSLVPYQGPVSNQLMPQQLTTRGQGGLFSPMPHMSPMPLNSFGMASPMRGPSSMDSGLHRPFHQYGRPEGRRQNAMRIARGPSHNAANNYNQVDVNRIRSGTDVRTTIMLRNIPNKVDQALLKSIVDESSWGKYDFMYLRIDFANDCNVGYAFINFVDPLDIIDFVNARANQRWNCFRSDKVAEVSYATIQGKDCLVQKFRNSSVMLEAPHYRPKLYFTENGPYPERAGTEEPFPAPDNQSKMKRSCENAEHVGLFTPNAGQQFRDEQRRRRSQFDRGNPRLEEYDRDPSSPYTSSSYNSPYNSYYGSQ
ncbi:RNA recognition motif 2-domain-containing protein [Hypoxylon sp. NC1633]|nr:RNA recognition motif 2-domain-containing protein [Hypoxylon sp. NC1633]